MWWIQSRGSEDLLVPSHLFETETEILKALGLHNFARGWAINGGASRGRVLNLSRIKKNVSNELVKSNVNHDIFFICMAFN